MQYWEKKRKISFWFHCVVFAMPMIVSIISAAYFWQSHTGNLLIGLIAIAIIECIALSSFVMHLLGIATKFYWLKQSLPFVSSIAIAEFLWNLFYPLNTLPVSLLLTSVSLVIVVVWIFSAMKGIEESVKSFGQISPEFQLLQQVRTMRAYAEQELVQHIIDTIAYAHSISVARNPSITKTYACPKCLTPLSQQQAAAAARYGYCGKCKEKGDALDAA